MELVGSGRTAEVFAIRPGAVVKLDRVEFNGYAEHEAMIMREVARSGLPVPEVIDTVTIDGRHGIVMERLAGPPLSQLIRTSGDLGDLAEAFVELQAGLHAGAAPSAPNLIDRLAAEIERGDLPIATRKQLVGRVRSYSGAIGLCHFDFHPDNVIVTDTGWKLIDWLAAASGPPAVDFARTLLLRADATDDRTVEFMRHVRTFGMRRHDLDDAELDGWTRVVAAARLSEGFDDDYASRLKAIALGGA